MATIKTEWHGPRRKAELMAEMKRRLSACAIIVASEAKRLVSTAGTGQARDKRGKFKRLYGANPSKPGDPPHKQTGTLRRSITWMIAGTIARVGTNLPYGRWLELGTTKMAARPWLRRALAMCRDRINSILSRPLN